MSEQRTSAGSDDQDRPDDESTTGRPDSSLAEEAVRVARMLGMIAATVVVAVLAARLIQAVLTALGLGFG